MPGLDPNAVHVINGDSAAGTFRQAISSSMRTIVSRDILSVGPLLPVADLLSWRDMRVGFWREVVAHDPRVDLRPAQNGIWENYDKLASTRRIYAWAATGNSDQFMVAFMLEMMERIGSDPGKVELVEFEHLPPAGRRVVQMGELDANQMRMHPAPRELSMDEWMSFRNAWRVLTSDDPATVLSFARDNPQASQWLRRSVGHLTRRYPDRATGLDFWDRQLLQNVRERGPRAARVVGYTMGEHMDGGDLIGDLYFFWRLLHMASPALPEPLLTMSGSGSAMQDTNFELTDFGAQVCAGKVSTWPVNPIDYWAGGVHVSSAAGNLWFIDDGRLSGA
ncbi:MAG TPA: DUF1835 domain-containing protein [Steroidobacteraceae bacterium]|nr:DUF1835 domain-containing protein [Steroidobacteraceae bacterium]